MLEGSPSHVAHVCAINMHSNWYCMVEESPHIWFTCVAISMHGGSPHVWVTCVAISINHTLIQVLSYWTQFLKKKIKIPLENPCTWVTILSQVENPCTWVTTLPTVKCVTNTLISWPEKTKKKKEIETCVKFVSPQQLLWVSLSSCVSKLLLGCLGNFLCGIAMLQHTA